MFLVDADVYCKNCNHLIVKIKDKWLHLCGCCSKTSYCCHMCDGNKICQKPEPKVVVIPMAFPVRATPILKGKAAKRFKEIINDGFVSKEQKKFLEDCVKLAKKTKAKKIKRYK